MSKSIVVFSTYYNYPVYPDKLFNRDSCSSPQMGKYLKEFFIERLKEDKEDTAWLHLLDYLSEDQKQKIGKEIEYARRVDVEQIEREIRSEKCSVNQYLGEEMRLTSDEIDGADFECWIDDLKDLNEDKFLKIIKLYQKWNDLQCYDEYKMEYLKDRIDPNDLEINNKGVQEAYDIYCSSADIPEEHPWLYNRISYYKLKASNDEVSIYAVWPLSNSSAPYAKDEDGTIDCDWIEALKKQFFSLDKDCKTIYFCLHAKDLFGSNTQKTVIYKSYGPNIVDNKNVVVILFQHPKPIGELLSQNGKNAHDVLEFIQKETLKLGLIDLKSTVNPSGISRTRELLEFYHNYDFCRTEVEDIINKLTTYECADENIKYQLGKEIKMSINHIGDKI